MMDNLNLKPQSPDEVKTMMWTGENQREMFDLLTCGKKIDDYMTASGENFFIDHKLLLEQNSQLKEQNKHLNMVILSVCSKSVRDRKDQEEKREKATERDTPEKETPESSV